MTFSTSKMARSARRAQFRIVSEPTVADGLHRKDSNIARKDPLALKQPSGDSTDFAPAPFDPPAQTTIVDLYRQTFARLGTLVEECDPDGPDDFFHAMRFMQLLGLSSDTVADRLNYRQENICRWMNGQRRPHSAMRKYVLTQCMDILRENVEVPRPPAFTRSAEREPQASQG